MRPCQVSFLNKFFTVGVCTQTLLVNTWEIYNNLFPVTNDKHWYVCVSVYLMKKTLAKHE